MIRFEIAALMGAVAIVGACSSDKPKDTVERPKEDAPWAPAKLTSVKGVPANAIEASLKRQLSGNPPAQIDESQWKHAKSLYRTYGDNPLWLAPDGLHTDRTFALANAILQAEQDGMRMDAYPIGALAQSIAEVEQSKTPTADQLAQADMILTASFAALGKDYLTGQIDPKNIAQAWHIDRNKERVDSSLARAIRFSAIDRAITFMRPDGPDYTGLRKALDQFQRVVAKGGWPAVPSGDAVKPGDRISSTRLALLRRRLALEGFAPADSSTAGARPASQSNAQNTASVYDRAAAGAVAAFQAHHGIVVDSVLGKETVDAMNKPAAYRAAQIAANLERLRWLPRTLGSRYVYVNVPAFRLEAYDGDKKALDMKVIVGQDYADKATPVFSDVMETVVFRPYWNVTPDIAAKEIFPKMEADPGYLAAHNYELYQEGGETRVRQKPGDDNALGDVKFLFPNDFNIYLHDTPNQELFEKDVRAFSHGCIRVEKPADLAQWVLGWDRARVEAAMHGSDNNAVKVPQKIPVFIVYGTAYIRDGQLYFGNDLYGRDDKLVDEVLRGALPRPETVKAVEALRRIAARA